MPEGKKLSEFVAWCPSHIIGDERGQAQIFLDRLFSAFGYLGGLKEAGTCLEMRVKLVTEDCIQPKPDSKAES